MPKSEWPYDSMYETERPDVGMSESEMLDAQRLSMKKGLMAHCLSLKHRMLNA
jgi:hypothetical protein